jgi:hypothetical protein
MRRLLSRDESSSDFYARRVRIATLLVAMTVVAGCGGTSTSSYRAAAPKVMGIGCFRRADVTIASSTKDIRWFTADRLLSRTDHPGFIALISKRPRRITMVDQWQRSQGQPGPDWRLWAARPFGYPGPKELPVEKFFTLPNGSGYVAYTNHLSAAQRVNECLARMHKRLSVAG